MQPFGFMTDLNTRLYVHVNFLAWPCALYSSISAWSRRRPRFNCDFFGLSPPESIHADLHLLGHFSAPIAVSLPFAPSLPPPPPYSCCLQEL